MKGIKIRIQLKLTRTLCEGDTPSVRHEIDEELELKSGGLGYRISKAVPNLCSGSRAAVTGEGKSESLAIFNWLQNLSAEMSYRPAYMERRCPMCNRDDVVVDGVCSLCGYRKGIKCGERFEQKLYLCDGEHDPSQKCKNPARPAGHTLEPEKSL